MKTKKNISKFIVLGLDGACPDIFEGKLSQGLMPNLKRLKEQGCWGDNIPFPSAVTPGNWTSIATGSKPSTHGISDFTMHTVGQPLDEHYDVFTKDRNNLAEFAWDAYSRRGLKTATIAYPGSLPQTEKKHLAIGNSGMPAENADPYTIAPSRALTAGSPNPVGPYGWQEHEKIDLQSTNDELGIAGFESRYFIDIRIKALNPGFKGEHGTRLYLGTLQQKVAGVLCCMNEKILLGIQEWTPFLDFSFSHETEIIGQCRMRITTADLEKGNLLLYISTVYPKYYFSTNSADTDGLRDKLGPYNDNLPISRFLMGWLDDQALSDEFRLQGVWEARAAVELVSNLGYRGVFAKWHAFDKFYHFFMQKIDPAAPGYCTDEYARYEKLHDMLIKTADEMIGIVLDGMDKETTLVVISDHGLMASRKAVWVNRFLARHGYISHTEEGGLDVVDWKKTRAFVSAFMLLNVNLKGRDPDGIVEPGEEYEALKKELIELLRGWKDPENNTHVMSAVFDPGKDGIFYGLGNDRDGDIRYFTTPGYTLYRSTAVNGKELLTNTFGPYLGDHGSCIPSTRFSRGGEVGAFYISGKGIRHRDGKMQIFPCDVIPTLLQIAGEKPLANQEGAVIHKCLDCADIP
ncbi:MAG: alkaline phosphatase family protein [Victivallales bacterium]